MVLLCITVVAFGYVVFQLWHGRNSAFALDACQWLLVESLSVEGIPDQNALKRETDDAEHPKVLANKIKEVKEKHTWKKIPMELSFWLPLIVMALAGFGAGSAVGCEPSKLVSKLPAHDLITL